MVGHLPSSPSLFLSLSLSLSLSLPVKICVIVVFLMVVAGGPDPTSPWVDLAPYWLDLALAACRRA